MLRAKLCDAASVNGLYSAEVLQEGMKLIEQMRGKKLIFLVGDTGSGKSTTASYFMNIKLEAPA